MHFCKNCHRKYCHAKTFSWLIDETTINLSIFIYVLQWFDSLSIQYDCNGKFTFIWRNTITVLPNITRVYLSPKEFDWLRKNRSDLTYIHKVNCSNYMHIWLFDCCIFMHVLNRSRMDCWWWMMVNIFSSGKMSENLSKHFLCEIITQHVRPTWEDETLLHFHQ